MRWVKVVAANVFILVILLSAVEAIFVFKPNKKRTVQISTNNYFKPDSYLGRLYKKHQKVREKAFWGKQTLYDYQFQTDENGWRKTFQPDHLHTDKHFIFLGCSSTFGVGVSDENTLPSEFANFSTKHHVYNFGGQGWGPAHALSLLEHKNLASVVKESEGVGVYLFYNFQIVRALSSFVTTTWMKTGPYYAWTGNKLEFQGLFNQVRPWPYDFYWLLARSSFVTHLGLSLPILNRPKYRFISHMLAQMEEAYQKTFPQGKFLIVLMEEPETTLLVELRKQKVSYIRLNYIDWSDSFQIPYDHHLNERGTKVVAESLFKQLNAIQVIEY